MECRGFFFAFEYRGGVLNEGWRKYFLLVIRNMHCKAGGKIVKLFFKLGQKREIFVESKGDFTNSFEVCFKIKSLHRLFRLH